MVDHEVDGNARLDVAGVAAEPRDGVAQRREVGDGRHAGEVLHEHARRHELQLAMTGFLRRTAAIGNGANVVGGDVAAVFPAQQVLDEHAHRIRQLMRIADDGIEPKHVVRLVTDGKTRARTEAVKRYGSHETEATLRPVADVIAVDVGGTKLAAGLVRDDGTLVSRVDAPTPLDVGADALFATLTDLVDRLDAPGAVAVGVGCGGPMDAGGEHVSPLNIHAWRGFPLRARLAAHTGRPTWVDNDAKALALGEGWTGAARGARDYIGMVVSTGVGGGIVLDGRLLDGADGNAGHIGHVIVEPAGRGVRVRRARLPRGRGVGLRHRPVHRRAAGRRVARAAGAHRNARRPRGRVGREPARPAARGRERLRRARLRRAVLHRRAARARRELPPRLLSRHPDRPRRARRRRPPDRRRAGRVPPAVAASVREFEPA